MTHEANPKKLEEIKKALDDSRFPSDYGHTLLWDARWLAGEVERLRQGLGHLEQDAQAHEDAVIAKRIRRLLDGGKP